MISPLIQDDKFAFPFTVGIVAFLLIGAVFLVLTPESLAKNLFYYLGLMLAGILVSAVAAYAAPKLWSLNIGQEQKAYLGILAGLGLGILLSLNNGTNYSILKSLSLILGNLSILSEITNKFFTFIVAPIAEEYVFRGILLNLIFFLTVKIIGEKNRYSRPLGIITAVLVSSFFYFAALHIFAYGTNNILQDFLKLDSIGVIGAIFAIADIFAGTILLSICYHFVNNMAASGLSGIEIIVNSIVFGFFLIVFIRISTAISGTGTRT